MFYTKDNFKGRWGESLACNVCGELDTDQHLFHCAGFCDLITDSITYKMFFRESTSLEELRDASLVMIRVNNRLKIIQES